MTNPATTHTDSSTGAPQQRKQLGFPGLLELLSPSSAYGADLPPTPSSPRPAPVRAELSTVTSNDLTRAHPDLRTKIQQLKSMFEAQNPSWTVAVNDVTRSAKDQKLAYQKGYSTVDGSSQVGKHNYYPSLAVDLNIRSAENGRVPDRTDLHKLYSSLGELAEELGLRWGGRWTVPYDPYHFELPQRGPLSPPQVKVPHIAEVGEPVSYTRSTGARTGRVEQIIDPSALLDGSPNGKPTYLVRDSEGKLVVVPASSLKRRLVASAQAISK